MSDKTLTLDQFRTLRKDAWWKEPLMVVLVLGGFAIYATWAALQNANYYFAPYLSPFYSPCLAANCTHVTLPLVGSWWNLSPAFPHSRYSARISGHLLLLSQGLLSLVFLVAARLRHPGRESRSLLGRNPLPVSPSKTCTATSSTCLLWSCCFWGGMPSWPFRFPTGFGIGLGTIILIANATLLSLYTLSCHSCRHFCGGYLDTFHQSARKRCPTLAKHAEPTQ